MKKIIQLVSFLLIASFSFCSAGTAWSKSYEHGVSVKKSKKLVSKKSVLMTRARVAKTKKHYKSKLDANSVKSASVIPAQAATYPVFRPVQPSFVTASATVQRNPYLPQDAQVPAHLAVAYVPARPSQGNPYLANSVQFVQANAQPAAEMQSARTVNYYLSGNIPVQPVVTTAPTASNPYLSSSKSAPVSRAETNTAAPDPWQARSALSNATVLTSAPPVYVASAVPVQKLNSAPQVTTVVESGRIEVAQQPYTKQSSSSLAAPLDPLESLGGLLNSIKQGIPLLADGDQALLPTIKTVYPTGEKPLKVLTFKCPTEMLGITPPPMKLLHEAVNLGMDAINKTNLLSFNMQQVCQ